MSSFRQSQPDRESGLVVRALSLGFASRSRLELHQHDWAQLIYAAHGALAVETASKHWVVPPHRCLWVPAGVTHSVEPIGETAMRTLYLRPDVATAIPGEIRVRDVSPLLRELILEVTLLGMLDEAVDYQAALSRVLLGLIDQARTLHLDLPLPQDPRARRVVQRVLHALDGKAPLAELVRGTGASPRTIERIFRAETGLSFGRWRQQARLHHAARRLSEGSDVTTVASDCGYESVSAFVAMFKRSLGTTPGQYFEGGRPRAVPGEVSR
jgi:AraC-like DNA-binding protein